MKLPIPIGVDSPLGKRLVALSFFRLGVLALFLVFIQLYYFRLELRGFSSIVAMATTTLAFFTTAAYAFLLRKGRALERLAFTQLVTDQLTWTAIVYISGGVTSGTASLYGLTCLSGAILLGAPGALVAALTGTTLYLGMCVGFATGWLRPPVDQAPEAYIVAASEMVYPAFSTVLAIALVTLLSSYLAERLRVFGGRLEEATKRAEEAERMAALGRLAAGLAHEIRNPLGSIRGSIELLRFGGSLSDEDQRLCRIIEQETARLNQLVTDMVDLSRPREPTMSEVDLAAIVQAVVELARTAARGSEVDVSYQGPPTLLVLADHGQMHQVLWNLVRNAMQVSTAGSEVTVALERTKAGVGLTVTDRGPGIPEQERERIWDAFFSTRKHGVGIGLAVVKRIVDSHGFGISVKSAPGEGTTFSVRIPPARVVAAALALLAAGCAGSDWVRSHPAVADHDAAALTGWVETATPEPAPAARPEPPPAETQPAAEAPVEAGGAPLPIALRGRPSAGRERFRNTYYYFPHEPSHPELGPTRELFDAACAPIRTVSQDFHDRLCVQGSGKLASGETVSFAKRDCRCAAECPRSGQKICYELLDRRRFPFGRGATGRPITPLRSVAVDSSVIPLGTVLYIPEFHGLRDTSGKPHDGCFVAEDRGSKVRGKHVDVFAGDLATVEAWNRAVPSNLGVTVIIGAARCAHLEAQKKR